MNKIIIGIFIVVLLIGATMPSLGSINDIGPIVGEKLLNNGLSFDFKSPKSNIRSPSEFEIADELIISWPKEVWGEEQSDIEFYFTELVKNSEDSLSVNIVVDNSNMQSDIESTLQNNDIPLDNVTFTYIKTNSIWIRDYGPFFVEENNELSIIDVNYFNHYLSIVAYIKYLLDGYFYNIPSFFRIQDNLFPMRYAKEYDLSYDFLFLYSLQGGNYMSDGQGTGFVGDVLFEKNPFLTANRVENRLKQLLDLSELIVLESQSTWLDEGGDGTGHIDMFSKIVDRNTIIVGQWNPDDPNYHILENNVQIFENLGYEVLRVPMIRNPDNTDDYYNTTIWSYTNSLIINGTNKNVVLLPIYGIPEDDVAISVYEQAMPDYEIRGIMSDVIIEHYGAVHCTTITRPYIS